MNIKTSMIKKLVSKPGFSGFTILIVMLIITAILQDGFFTMTAIINNMNAFIPLILITMGQGVVMISGGIDLSVGPALSLLTCVLASIMKKGDPMSGVFAILVAAGVAVVMGIINGIGMGYLRLPPVVVTYATSYIFLGAALLILPLPGGSCVEWVKGFYNFANIQNVPAWLVGLGKVISPSILLLILGLVAAAIIGRTRFARYSYAMGSNEASAYASGINTARTMTKACIINSFFILFAALFFVAQNLSGDARLGGPFVLKSIAAAVVGGIVLTGGKGSLYSAVVGAFILSFVNKIIFFLHLPNTMQTLVGGLIVILAIAASQLYSFISNRTMLKEDRKNG
jgi:ribose transport system permease protein